MDRPKVYLTGGDTIQWALDDDLRLTRRALEGTVNFATLEDCDVVHSVWWEGLVGIPAETLAGKRVICHMSGEPFRYVSLPEFRRVAALVGRWIAQTRQAERELAGIGIDSTFVPYTVDTDLFRPLPADGANVLALREQWKIPTNRYLIGNFHRDTEGRDLRSPKLAKGPDIFAEIVRALKEKGHPIHVVLAGPRRGWLRRRLANLDIPYTFVGEIVEGQDDFATNLLPQPILNLLYNLIDLYVISSRTEGGPRSVMEAAAARRKVISTAVGLSLDILEGECLYDSPVHAVEIIARDIETDHVRVAIEAQYQRVIQNHRPRAVAPLFRRLYAEIEQIPPLAVAVRPMVKQRRWRVRKVLHCLVRRPQAELTVGIWQRFFKPPYGGGNQFMLALCKALLQRGIRVKENVLHPGIDVYLLNSIHFDVDRFLESKGRSGLRVVQRIDGPIHLIRGFDREKDELCFRLNAEFAQATVIQSAWTYERIVEMGYVPKNAVIIHNAVDRQIFHPQGRIRFDPNRKIRLISSSWSDNPRKGGPIYKWIDDRLDKDRFEYTFVGKASERFDHIRQIPPLPSDGLADLLRQHDIYITASSNDPCSNAVIEALACGLPVLYLNEGGHPEIVGYGGLPFNTVEEILPQLDTLVTHYEMFQNLIVTPNLDDVVERYLRVLREVAHSS